MRLMSAALVGAAVLSLSGRPAVAQRSCTLPPLEIPITTRPIALTEAQEVDLGDAIAEHLHRVFPPVDDELNATLQRVGERILARLPPSKLAYRFRLINQPIANAFALPGGRIYVTRKMVALTRSEDELAGVLGHEIGHLITRQIGADITALFRKGLNIRSFGDRRDVFEKYRQLVDNPKPWPARSARHDEQNQYDADAVALAAVARAGYAPAAYVELWDRFTETEQRTGNFFSDLFGVTRPESRRLREMLRAIPAVPEECSPLAVAAATGDFEAWRLRVIEGGAAGSIVRSNAVTDQRLLEPPLRDDVTHLKFSPDGRFVLAQDDAGIYVLTREPFAVSFRIDAEGAQPAQFTPDSTHVVFHTSGLRVERWDVATGTRMAVHEIVVREPCVQTALSPDGRVAVCFDLNRMLQLIDVETQAVIYKKDRTHTLGFLHLLEPVLGPGGFPISPISYLTLAFSPDGRYLVAANFASALAIDIERRAEIPVRGELGKAFQRGFTFLGVDRIVSVDRRDPAGSEIVRFPTGERIKTLTLGGRVTAATAGNYVMLRPVRGWALGVVDVASGRIIFANKTSAFDVHQTVHVSERLNGELGLYSLASPKPIATASLPKAPLAELRVAHASDDLEWLALSTRDRGGVWRLDTGARVAHVLGFSGAFVGDGALYADIPKGTRVRDGKPEEHNRTIVRLDLQRSTTVDHAAVGDGFSMVVGRSMIVARPDKPDAWDRNVTFEIHDVPASRLRWSRRFTRQPPMRWHVDAANGRMIFQWTLSSPEAREILKHEPRLRAAVSSNRLADGDALLEIVHLADGQTAGRIVVNTGNDERRITRVTSSGDAVVVADLTNQLAVYSIADGRRRGSAFGRYAVPSAAASLLCLENEPGKLEFVDLGTLERRDVIETGSALRLAQFSEDGRRLIVLTADQIVRTIDVAALGAAAQ